MSKFKGLSARVDSFEALCAEIRGLPDAASADAEVMAAARHSISTWREQSAAIADELRLFVARAKEPDPEKRIYGKKMADKILALEARFVEVGEGLEEGAVLEWTAELDGAAAAAAAAAEAAAASERAQREAAAHEAAQAEAERAAAATALREQRAAAAAAEAEREAETRAAAAAERAEQAAAERVRVSQMLQLTPAEALELLVKRNPASVARTMVRTLQALMRQITDDPGTEQWRKLRKYNASLQRDLLQYAGGEEFLVACGFRLRMQRVTGKARLLARLRAYYALFAPPEEAAKVDFEKVASHYAPQPSVLWERLEEKYGRSLRDLEVATGAAADGAAAAAGLPAELAAALRQSEREGELFYVLDEPSAAEDMDAWSRWFAGVRAAKEAVDATARAEGFG